MKANTLGFWLGLCVILLLAPVIAQLFLPNQPAGFTSRGSSPFLAYSFRQSECSTGVISSDVALSALPLTLLGNGVTACPIRNTFESGIIGASINASRPQDRNAMVSATIGNVFNSVTNTAGGSKAFSVEVWFSFTKEAADGEINTLIEIGGLSGTTEAVGALAENTHFRVTYRRFTSGSDQLSIDYVIQRVSSPDPPIAVSVTRNAGSLDSDADYNTNLEGVGDNALGTIHMLVVTIATNNAVQAYVGPAGGVLGTHSGSGSASITRNYAFANDTAVVRIGCTRSPGTPPNNLRNFPGTIHFAAFYNTELNVSTVTSMLAAGLPNSLPAVKSAAFVTSEDIAGAINLNQPSIVFDFNNDPISTFYVDRPNVGTLLYNGVPITIDNFQVANVALLTYLSTPNATTGSVVTCAGQQHARFNFWATDGLCDRTSTPPGSTNCKSPVAAVASICVTEQNDPPTVVPPPGEFPVFNEANNTMAFTITCSDIDNTTSVFGLHQVRIVSNSNATLGRVIIDPSGTGNCLGDGGNNLNVSFSTAQTSSRTATLTFCYEAFNTQTSQVEVGRDIITYQCIDKNGAAATGTLTVVVKNALIAGCGFPTTTRQQWINGMPCYERGVEDQPVLVRLSGFDAVASHIPNRRFYKIDSLPPMGKLHYLNGSEVPLGAQIQANFTTVSNVSEIFGFPSNQVATLPGNLTLVFVPSQNAFNSICGLSIDPTRNAANGRARCGSPIPSETVPLVYQDGLNLPLNAYNPCGNTATGCQLNFSYSLGYDDSFDAIDNPFFGPSMSQIVRLDVVGVNDGNGVLSGPANLTMARTSFDFRLNSNSTTTPLRYEDPDGDTYRVGFIINVQGRRANAKARQFTNAISAVPPYLRMTFVEGEDCIESGGASCFFEGRAFKTDLNRFFDNIDLSTTVSTRSNDTLNVTIFDGADLPNEYQPDGPQSIETVNSIIATHRVVLLFGRDTDGSDGGNPLTTALWAGIVAGLFFVAMSCLAFWGCIIMRAKRGEEAAVWAVRNLLCTDVEHRKHPDISKLAAGGRRSLETAIHAEHARLARVVCCALFMRRVCPCMVKFDDKELKVPDEEDMLQEAVNQTKKRIASIHRPKNAPGPVTASNAKSDDVEDVVAEDVLADDSIFDWERHMDDKTGRVFYYNVKTHESRWTPPTVKVHEQRKITDRTSVKNPEMHQPKPPEQPKAGGSKVDDDNDADRVKKN